MTGRVHTSWNKPAIVLLAVCLGLVAYIAYLHSGSSRHEQEAAELDSIAEAAVNRADSIAEERDSIARADSVFRAEYDDSVAVWEAEQDSLREEIEDEREHHSALADSVRERVDSATAAMVDRMQESLDAALAKADSIEESKGVQLAVVTSALDRKDSIIALQQREIEELRVAYDVQKQSNDALLRATRSLRLQRNSGYVVAGAAIVFAALSG